MSIFESRNRTKAIMYVHKFSSLSSLKVLNSLSSNVQSVLKFHSRKQATKQQASNKAASKQKYVHIKYISGLSWREFEFLTLFHLHISLHETSSHLLILQVLIYVSVKSKTAPQDQCNEFQCHESPVRNLPSDQVKLLNIFHFFRP